MAKGNVLKGEEITVKDPMTGVEVIRLSPNIGNTFHPYFTQPLFSFDGKHVLVASDRTGTWQLYDLIISTGSMIQLTDEPHVQPGSALLDPNTMTAYYWADNTLKSVALDTLDEESYYTLPQGFHGSILSITGDGNLIHFAYSENLNLSMSTGKIYSHMNETLFRRPSSVIMQVNVKDKSAKAIWGEREWISHVNTSPVDSDIVCFCHEGPWHLVQRTWIVRPSTSEVWPIVETKRYVERAGHEVFTHSGRICTQYGRRKSPTHEWKCADLFINPDGSNMSMYEYKPGRKPMHVQVDSTESYGVADGAYLVGGPQNGNDYISLVKYDNGLARQKILCTHGTSWNAQNSHPHPVWFPDDSMILFTSDREGNCNVYMAPGDYETLK
jgi:oligogalacturonide lyase